MRKINLRHRNWVVSIEYPENPSEWTSRREAVFRAVENQDRPALANHGAEILEVYEEQATALGGTLTRNIVGQWIWSDGSPAPYVRDLLYRDTWPNYRVRCNSHVEVLSRDLSGKSELSEELSWVPAASEGKASSGDHSGMRVIHGDGRMTRAYADPTSGETTGAKVIPQVYLVPCTEWDRRALRVCGAQWDQKDEPQILAKAKSLGWKGGAQ